MPFGIVVCTFSDNLSRNSCIYIYIQLIVSQKVHRTWASHCSQKRIEGITKPGELRYFRTALVVLQAPQDYTGIQYYVLCIKRYLECEDLHVTCVLPTICFQKKLLHDVSFEKYFILCELRGQLALEETK